MNDYSNGTSGMGAFMGFMSFIYFLAIIASIAGMWKIFQKAGEEGWKAIIPIYNLIILLKVIGKPWWWLFLFCIPLVNIYAAVMVCYLLAKSFGKDVGFAVGIFFLGFIFIPMLGFGSARYIGPGGNAQDLNQSIGSIGLS